MLAQYREYRPPARLRAVSACLWERTPPADHVQLVIPDGCVDLILLAGTDWCWQARTPARGGSRCRAGPPHPASGSGRPRWGRSWAGRPPRSADQARAQAAIERIRPALRADGSLPVPGGTEGEHLTPLGLSPRPGRRSRALFTDGQIDADLDVLEASQQADGGWMFDFLAWSPGQSAEWRGIVTLLALTTLDAHGRITLPG
jgi:hypothetical protein